MLIPKTSFVGTWWNFLPFAFTVGSQTKINALIAAIYVVAIVSEKFLDRTFTH